MAKRANRVAWGLVAGLTVVLLAGAGIYVGRLVTDPAVAFYRFGAERGLQDDRSAVGLCPTLAADPPSAFLYLQWAPAIIEAELPFPRTSAERQARKRRIEWASHLAEVAASAPASKQNRYLRAFVSGYLFGQRLQRSGK